MAVKTMSGAYTAEELHGLGIAYTHKRGIGNNSDLYDDCVQAFVLAGLEAAQKDDGRGIRAYQYTCGRGAVLKWITRYSCIQKAESLESDSEQDSNGDDFGHGGEVLEDAEYVESGRHTSRRFENPLIALVKQEEHDRLTEALATLTDRERDILSARYTDADAETMESVADRMGITKGRVAQIEAACLERLRSHLRARSN